MREGPQSGAVFPGCRKSSSGLRKCLSASEECRMGLAPHPDPLPAPATRDVNVAGTPARGERESTEHVAPLSIKFAKRAVFQSSWPGSSGHPRLGCRETWMRGTTGSPSTLSAGCPGPRMTVRTAIQRNGKMHQMDWFESLTGFRETGYANTRAKLKVEGGRLHSRVNGKSYGIALEPSRPKSSPRMTSSPACKAAGPRVNILSAGE